MQKFRGQTEPEGKSSRLNDMRFCHSLNLCGLSLLESSIRLDSGTVWAAWSHYFRYHESTLSKLVVAAGYETLTDSTNYDLHRMEICAQRMLERTVDGVAVMTFGTEEARWLQF